MNIQSKMKTDWSFWVWLVLRIHLKRVSQKPSTNANRQASSSEWSLVTSRKQLSPLPRTPTSFPTVMKDLTKVNQVTTSSWKASNLEKWLEASFKMLSTIKIMSETSKCLRSFPKSSEYWLDHHLKISIFWPQVLRNWVMLLP